MNSSVGIGRRVRWFNNDTRLGASGACLCSTRRNDTAVTGSGEMGRLRWTSEVAHLHKQCLRHDGKARRAGRSGRVMHRERVQRHVQAETHCCGENTSMGRNRKALMRDRGNTIGDSGVFVFLRDQLCVPTSARVVSRLSRQWRGGCEILIPQRFRTRGIL